MLSIPQLTIESKNKHLLALKDFSLGAGEFAGIVGPNGAGKSTLLKSISGDIKHNGQILFNGLEMKQWTPLMRARHIGVLPQSGQLTFPFKASEVVALGLTPLKIDKSASQRLVEEHMAHTDCLHLANKPYPRLSGGEQQRVQLARVLLQLSQSEQSPLLLLDEPTSAQDLKQQHALLDLVQTLCRQKGYSCLAILHDLNLVLRYCDACFLIDQGEIRAQGTPSACLTPETIESSWGYKPEKIRSSIQQRCVLI